jgi:hypothetical protein
MTNRKARVPIYSAIILRLEKYLFSQQNTKKNQQEQDEDQLVLDVLIGILNHSRRVPKYYRKRFLDGINRLRNSYGRKDSSLDKQLKQIIEFHS